MVTSTRYQKHNILKEGGTGHVWFGLEVFYVVGETEKTKTQPKKIEREFRSERGVLILGTKSPRTTRSLQSSSPDAHRPEITPRQEITPRPDAYSREALKHYEKHYQEDKRDFQGHAAAGGAQVGADAARAGQHVHLQPLGVSVASGSMEFFLCISQNGHIFMFFSQ